MNKRNPVFIIPFVVSMVGLVFLGTTASSIQGQIPMMWSLITAKSKVISNINAANKGASKLNTTKATMPTEAAKLDKQAAVLFKEGKYTEAIAYFNKALDVNPNYAFALIGKGIVLVKLGKYGESIQVLDKALSIIPQNVNALNYKKIAVNALKKK